MLKHISTATLGLVIGLAVSPLFAQAQNQEKAAPTNMGFGKGNLTAVEVKNLHHSGKLLVKKIKVTDSTIINGSFEASESQFNKETVVNGNLVASASSFNDLSVNGNVKLTTVLVNGNTNINGKLTTEKCEFKDNFNINGNLEAKETSFAKTIKAKGVEASFENCKVNGITVEKTENDAVQKITLKGTAVTGDITFDSGKGIVEQDDKSSISGKVNGGQVEKK